MAQTIKLRFGSIEPPTAPITARALTPWAKEVSAASGGTLDIEMYAGGTLGRNPMQQIKLLQDGVADFVWASPAFTPGRFGGNEVVELPFIVQNVREGGLALWRIYQQGLLTGYDDFKVLMIGVSSPGIINSRTPIRTLADLKGIRMRAVGALRSKVVDSLGAVPVALPPTSVAESLSKDVIDATLGEWLFVETFKVDEVISNHFEMPLGSNALMVAMMKSKYDALPSAARAAIDKYSGEPFVRRFIEVFEVQEGATRDRVSKNVRARVTTPSAEEVNTWRKRTDPVVQAWRQESAQNERVYQAFEAELKKVRGAQ